MSKPQYEYDLVTLGAGSGGVRASRISSSTYQAKVAIVELPFDFISDEQHGGAGGTCVIRGCVPKKLLVYGSAFADEYADAEGFGWQKVKPSFDWKYLVSNKSHEITRLNGIYENILKNNNVEHIEGRGCIKDAHTILVKDPKTGNVIRELTTKNVLLAVGDSAHKLSIPGSEYTITSDEALSLPEQPKCIAIIGAGYIGVEFSFIFAGLGSEVHLFYRKKLPLSSFDDECREIVAENLDRKVNLHSETNPVKIEKNDDGTYTLTYKHTSGKEATIEADYVMMATGRIPNTQNQGLENAGVELGKKGSIVVDEYLRTNVPNIWALGDCIGRVELTPVALMEGMAFATSCFGPELKKPDYDGIPTAVFAQPPLGTVGPGEAECKDVFKGELDVYVSKFKPMKNTLSGRQERTLMKVIVHRDTDRVVGVHMVGPDAAEIIQGIGIALKAGATKRHFDTTVGVHPSSAEEFVSMRTKSRTIAGSGSVVPGT